MFKTRLLAAALAAGAALTGAAAVAVSALPAGASVSPTIQYSNQGVAGYYASPNATRTANGDEVTGVRAQFFERASAQSTTINQGVELCRFKTDGSVQAAAALFTVWNGTSYSVYAGHNTTTGCLNQLGGISGGSFTQIDTIPAGHTVFLSITVSSSHVVTYTDEDLTNATGASTSFGGFTFGFNRAGWGTNGNQSTLTAPASVKLSLFANAGVRDQGGWAFNSAHLTRLVLNQVRDTSDGTSAGDVLLTPAALSATGFALMRGSLSGV